MYCYYNFRALSDIDESDSDEMKSTPINLCMKNEPAFDDCYSDYIVDESDEVDDEEEEFSPEVCGDCTDDQPIFEGSQLTLSISIMLIMTFVMRHSMTRLAIADLLSLMKHTW